MDSPSLYQKNPQQLRASDNQVKKYSNKYSELKNLYTITSQQQDRIRVIHKQLNNEYILSQYQQRTNIKVQIEYSQKKRSEFFIAWFLAAIIFYKQLDTKFFNNLISPYERQEIKNYVQQMKIYPTITQKIQNMSKVLQIYSKYENIICKCFQTCYDEPHQSYKKIFKQLSKKAISIQKQDQKFSQRKEQITKFQIIITQNPSFTLITMTKFTEQSILSKMLKNYGKQKGSFISFNKTCKQLIVDIIYVFFIIPMKVIYYIVFTIPWKILSKIFSLLQLTYQAFKKVCSLLCSGLDIFKSIFNFAWEMLGTLKCVFCTIFCFWRPNKEAKTKQYQKVNYSDDV